MVTLQIKYIRKNYLKSVIDKLEITDQRFNYPYFDYKDEAITLDEMKTFSIQVYNKVITVESDKSTFDLKKEFIKKINELDIEKFVIDATPIHKNIIDIINKILFLSNKIASNCRLGHANMIITNMKIASFLKNHLDRLNKFKIHINNDIDYILIGYKNKDNQSGLVYFETEEFCDIHYFGAAEKNYVKLYLNPRIPLKEERLKKLDRII